MADRRLRFAIIVDFLVSDYSETILQGVTDFCDSHNIDLYIFPIGTLHSPQASYGYQNLSVASHITEEKFDGVIMTSGSQMHNVTLEYLKSFIHSFEPLPIVNISLPVEGIPSIIVNAAPGFAALLNHLIKDHGCKRFALMGVKSNSVEGLERTEIFKKTLKANNISLDDTVFWEAKFDYRSAKEEMEKYIAAGGKFNFDVIVSLNDEMAFACMDMAKRMKKRIPEDLFITGFDNIPRSRFTNPPLSTVSQELYVQGTKAAQTLLKLIQKKKVPELQTISSKAIVRKTCSCNETNFQNVTGRNIKCDTDDSFNNFGVASEWYIKRFQLIQATNFYTDSNTGNTISDLQNNLNWQVRNFDISSYAIVLYKNPVDKPEIFDHFDFPEKAYIYSGFDNKTGYESGAGEKPVYFNPNKSLLPEGYFEYQEGGVLVYPLFRGTRQYGYIVYNRGSQDLSVYDLFGRTVSALVDKASAYTERKDESDHYANQYNKMNIMAHTDELTGLKNRRGFLELADQAISLAASMEQKGLVLFCDMDGLKSINDTYGHESGDIAIKAESEILKKAFRTSDIIGRIGGDEFSVICNGMTEKEFAKIRKVVDRSCEEWTRKSKSPFKLSISMGFVSFPSETAGYNVRGLMAEADSALYLEKQSKKARKK